MANIFNDMMNGLEEANAAHLPGKQSATKSTYPPKSMRRRRETPEGAQRFPRSDPPRPSP
jgi:hypothetical protein